MATVVSSQNSEPVANAVVSIRETGDRTYSDSSGHFRFPRLVGGSYTLHIHHLTYRDVERRIVVPSPDSTVILMQSSPYQTGEVLVRSVRIDEAMNATPFPVSVLLGDHLAVGAPVAVCDVISTSPGIGVSRDGAWESAVSIRGLKQSHLVSLIDGVRIETATDIAGVMSLMNMQDIERTETIKTGGSVLYGTGAVGGVVSVTTKRPAFTEQQEFHAEAASGISSVNGGVSEYLALEGGSDFMAVRLSGGYRNAGNTRTPSGELPNSQFRDFTVAGTVDMRTAGDQTLELSYQRAQTDDAGIPGGAPFGQTVRATYTLARRELFRAEYRLPNLARSIGLLSFRAAYQEISRNVEVVQSPVLILTPHAVHASASAGVDAMLSPFDDDLLSVGIDIWQRSLDSRRERHNFTAGTVTGERPVPLSRFLSGGVYAQNEWKPFPGTLSLTLGGRYDAIQIWNADSWNPEYILTTGGTQSFTTGPQLLWPSEYAKNNSWSMSAGAWYACTQQLDAALCAGTSFRSPSLEERYQYIDLGSVVLVGNPGLQPERSVSLNGSLRFHRGAIRLQVDGFVNFMNNLVASVAGEFEGRSALVNANVGTARLTGGEATVEISLARTSGLLVSVSYVRGEDTQTHANLSQIPPLSGRFELRHRIGEICSAALSLDGVAAKGRLAPGEVSTAGYCPIDLELASMPISIGGSTIVVRGGVENLLDKDYREFLSTLRGVVRSAAGRNVFATIDVRL